MDRDTEPRAGTSDAGPSRGRALRNRTSDVTYKDTKRVSRSTGAGSGRIVSQDEVERAVWKLGPEGTAARREELIQEKEAQLRTIVQEHDMAVKEKFHLERYVSILEGWDPEDAKNDNSPVFLEYKHKDYDLLSLIPNSIIPGVQPAQALGRARTTRRQLQQKSNMVGHVTAMAKPTPPPKGKGKAKAVPEPEPEPETPVRTKGRGRKAAASATVEPESEAESARVSTPVAKGGARGKGKKGRRATMHNVDPEPEESVEPEDRPIPKGKKRGRQSMPNLPAKKVRALRKSEPSATASPRSSSPAQTPVKSPTPEPEPEPEPVALPSLAHLPFPPPPDRPKWRRSGPSRIIYTDPNQRPQTKPQHGGNLPAFLDSYIHIEDTGPPFTMQFLEQAALRGGWLRNRVNWLQHQGRLLRLLDEEDEGPETKGRDKSHQKKAPVGPPPRSTDYQDSLMAHMVQVRNAMAYEAKMKPQVCKRIARGVQLYWEHVQNKGERERQAQEKERRRKAKEMVKGLRKRWGLAVKIVRAKIAAQEKLEQDRLGKEHLQNMLQRSTGLLEGQRDHMLGAGEEYDSDSDATDDVSAAEESDEEGAEVGIEADDVAAERSEVVDEAPEEDSDGGSGEEDSGSEGEEGEGDDESRHDALRMLVGAEDADMEAPDDATPQTEDADADATADQTVGDVSLALVVESLAPLPSSEPANGAAVQPAEDAAFVAATAEMADPVPSSPAPAVEETEELPPPRPRSKRIQRRSIAASTATPDPDANDAEFQGSDSERDAQDAAFDDEMGENAAPEADSEDEGLLKDAEMPIEELLKRYGYPMPAAGQTSEAEAEVEEVAAEDEEARAETQVVVEPEAESASGDGVEVTTETVVDVTTEVDVPGEEEPAEEMDIFSEAVAELEAEARAEAEALANPKPPVATVTAETLSVAEKEKQIATSEPTVKPSSPTANGSMAEHEIATLEAAASQPNGHTESSQTQPPHPPVNTAMEVDVAPISEPAVDKSLTDEALAQRGSSPPGLIVEGKRQRKARQVWTPPDTPQALVTNKHKKPKMQIVADPTAPEEPEEAKEESDVEMESTPEPTPSLTSSEEETDDEEEEVEEGEPEPEDPNAPKLKPPFLLRGTLRPYQQAGMEWLASLYANNMNGILADEMGLGKTIQTIALLGHLACDKGVWGPHLIIVPTSVILNWEMEFKKFLPGMKVLTYYGNQKERKEKRVGWNTENHWQVCITSYQIVLADQHIFRRKNWCYMVLDEAHNIKNFRSQRWQTLLGFKTQHRLLLTGTPLQNNLMELWSLLYFLMPNGITADATAVVGFANHKEFMEWFSNPMDKAVESGESMDEETIEMVTRLHTLLRPFILRRLKSEVETQLPGKFEHVVYCRLSKRQRFLYDEFMARASTKEALTSGGYLGVVNTLMQLRKVCNHPDLFEVRPVRTSFAMDRGVATDFTPTDVLVRKRLLETKDQLDIEALNLSVTGHEWESGWVAGMRANLDASDRLPFADDTKPPRAPKLDMRTPTGWAKYREWKQQQQSMERWRALRDINRRRCQSGPIYGRTTLKMLSDLPHYLLPASEPHRISDMFGEHPPPAAPLVKSLYERERMLKPTMSKFAVIPPNAVARDVATLALQGVDPDHPDLIDPSFDTLHDATVRLQIAFPDASLLQYDCGKLQKLAEMLRDLKAGGHRCLIFTQMTRVLDILEIFLNFNGHRYLRLDGSTKIEDRQVLTERFNSDNRIFCFIASSRSGGVGINLTGADTVFFYDSDWNPAMDKQCMDRAHRIGQTREVHIYRFVSTATVEDAIWKRQCQKRELDRMVIQDGDFTTDFFAKTNWKDVLADEVVEDDRIEDIEVEAAPEAEDATVAEPRLGQQRDFAQALAEVEDEEDAEAARVAQGEGEMDFAEFTDKRPPEKPAVASRQSLAPTDGASASATPAPPAEGEEDEEYYDEDEPGGVDEYMLAWVEHDWDYFINFKV